MATLEGHEEEVNSVAYSPDGETLVSGSNDKTIRFWDVERGAAEWTFRGHQASQETPVTNVVFSQGILERSRSPTCSISCAAFRRRQAVIDG